jgi:lipopolysaccharide transport system ATP-binding protein
MTTSPTEFIKNNYNLQTNSIINLQTVSKKYPLLAQTDRNIQNGFTDLWALRDISLDVCQGEILGIIGRNGAGKTTLLNIIAGVLSPTEGKVNVKGRALGLFNLGVGFQDELTGRENIFLNGAILGATRKELETRADSTIEFSELGNFIDMPLGTYSQGMRLRLGFSIIANLNFDVLVIDEVLAVGDVLFQNKCFERLMDFRREGKTLIITTQSMELIERFCDKTALLDHGKLLFSGSAAEGINKYRGLLNTERFFVGPEEKNALLVENTKKWADDISNWGRKFGTKEVTIDSVEFINRFGWRTKKIKSREPLKIKVRFSAKNDVKEPHFGIAVFRNDGVYCYGPNTEFDGYSIPQIRAGKGWFMLQFREFLLASGKYVISAAVWDKFEVLAFDHHYGCYDLTVAGINKDGGLLDLEYKIHPPSRHSFCRKNLLNPFSLSDKQRACVEPEQIRLGSIESFTATGARKNVFRTNEPVKFLVDFAKLSAQNQNIYLWLGIYRDDGIYCQGMMLPVKNNKTFKISFPRLPLLPGGYKVSLGIYEPSNNNFLMCHQGIYQFCIVFNQEDHGTIYLEHKWRWRLP